MASNEPDDKMGFQPERTGNILTGSSHPGYPQGEIEQRPSSSESSVSGSEGKEHLERTRTNSSQRTQREPQFEPIAQGDRAELQRIASEFGGSVALARTRTNASQALERTDTLAGIEIGHPALDPSAPEFDVYKWARM